MRVLVLSSAFPSRTRPTYAVFVRERVRHVAAHCQVAVVAPVPWFPLNRYLRGASVSATPRADIERGGMPVYYPRFVCPPLVGKSADAVLYAASIAPVLAGLRRRHPFDLIDAHYFYPDGVDAAFFRDSRNADASLIPAPICRVWSTSDSTPRPQLA